VRDRLFLAPNQGACQASFFSPDPLHLLTVLSLRRSRSMLNDSSTQFVAALASPVESYEEVEQTSTNCPSKISRSIPQPPCLRLRLTVAQSFSSQAASTRRPNIILVYLILPPFITIPTTYSSCSTSSHFISGCNTFFASSNMSYWKKKSLNGCENVFEPGGGSAPV
jgi:hypothetical protein